MNLNPIKTVAILRGGPSHEYEVSLQSGKNVLDNLPREYYQPLDIFISKEGVWHEGGLEKAPESILKKVDVVFNCLHGAFGEDGALQSMLDKFGLPYTGSGSMASALGMNKIASKKIFEKTGLKTPFGVFVREEDLDKSKIREAFNTVPMPFVVKPAGSGSSMGVRVAYSLSELEEAMVSAFEYSPSVIVEEYISGKEGTCGVLDDWREEEHYALLPIEIRHQGKDFFDYQSKYADGTEEICPGVFTEAEKRQIEQMAVSAHRNLGLEHYSRSDFRIHPKRGVFILETNSLPGLTKNSLIPKSISALGIKFSDFLHHVVNLALKRK